MAVQMICCSHSPLMLTDIEESQDGEQARFNAAMAQVAGELRAFKPDLILSFGPDHFNGFFYDMMPPFCVGVAGEATHDWGIEGGPLRIPRELGLDCVKDLHAHDIDAALSHDIRIDHGTSISLAQLAGSLTRYDLLPVFVNCAADPRPSMRRARQLGAAVGRFLAQRDLRITIIGSGGLSHDPPTPRLARTSADLARRLIKRATPSADELKAREARVIRAARDLVEGKGPCMPPSPEWDRRFMQLVAASDFAALEAIDDAEIDREAGFGGHEVRTWVAALAAARELTGGASFEVRDRYYAVIPEWLTGMGVMTAEA